MAKNHLAKFRVCYSYTCKIGIEENNRDKTVVPHGAIYGRDEFGYWYCINKEVYPAMINGRYALETYRQNPRTGEWFLIIDTTDTIQFVIENLTDEIISMPVEYPKYTGASALSGKRYKSKCATGNPKPNGLKKANDEWFMRQPENTIKLDVWENAAPMMYEELNGKKRIKRPNWSKTQYIIKPY